MMIEDMKEEKRRRLRKLDFFLTVIYLTAISIIVPLLCGAMADWNPWMVFWPLVFMVIALIAYIRSHR